MVKTKFYKFTNMFGTGFKKVTYDGMYNHWERRIGKNKNFLGWNPKIAVSQKANKEILKRGWVECTEEEAKTIFNEY